jgi:hypothetical protein
LPEFSTLRFGKFSPKKTIKKKGAFLEGWQNIGVACSISRVGGGMHKRCFGHRG